MGRAAATNASCKRWARQWTYNAYGLAAFNRACTPLKSPDMLLAPLYACPQILKTSKPWNSRTDLMALYNVMAHVSGTWTISRKVSSTSPVSPAHHKQRPICSFRDSSHDSSTMIVKYWAVLISWTIAFCTSPAAASSISFWMSEDSYFALSGAESRMHIISELFLHAKSIISKTFSRFWDSADTSWPRKASPCLLKTHSKVKRGRARLIISFLLDCVAIYQIDNMAILICEGLHGLNSNPMISVDTTNMLLYTPNSTLEPFPVIVALLWIRICFPSWTIYIIRGDAKEKKNPDLFYVLPRRSW